MDKKELKKKYTQTIQPMGIYQVKNLTSGKIFIDSGLNVQGKINSCRFQLVHGSNKNKMLQEDFNKTSLDNFTFEVIDLLKPKEEPQTDYIKDLELLEEMWTEKLQPFDGKGYNVRKIVR